MCPLPPQVRDPRALQILPFQLTFAFGHKIYLIVARISLNMLQQYLIKLKTEQL